MRNSLRVFRRDWQRILTAPKVWVIVLGLVVLPSLYAWVNIIAFWDPYGDTKAIRVSVVNLDKGASSPMTGPLNVGDQVVDQLRDNHDIGWQFVDFDEGMDAVRSGTSYATIVIPESFSKDLLTIVTGDFVHPELEYYTNEKANAIAPKITEAAASTVDTQINSTFVSTVAKTIAEDLESAGIKADEKLTDARERTLDALTNARQTVQEARAGLTDMDASLSSTGVALDDAARALRSINGAIGDIQSAIDDAQSIVADVQQELITFTDAVTSAYVTGAAQLSDVSAKLNASVAKLTAGAQQANAVVGSAVVDATRVVAANGRIIAQLQELLDQLDPADPGYAGIADALGRLQERNAADQQLLTDLERLNGDIAVVIAAIQASADAMNAAVQDTAASARSIRDVLTRTIPDINRAMAAMSASAGAFSSALDAQRALTTQAAALLTDVEGGLTEATAVGVSLDQNLADVERDLGVLTTDLEALGAAQIWNTVRALTGLNPEQIATFMAAPVQVTQHTVFAVATYGSSMAPLFTNLALWIGAFMLVVLLKQETDPGGITGLTVRQAYMGRWMLLASLGIGQALLVSIGNIVIGVQMASAVAFVATSVFTGLVYIAIIYALAMSFGYVGKGIAILLVIMQIPGASGIYPIEMMPAFFQSVFPFFPFTYSIDAMRETIGGFYHAYYWRSFAVLALFAALAFILGLFVRQRLGGFARLFNQNLADTGLFVTEDVQILGSRRRLTQLAQALSDRKTFRETTAKRAAWFHAHHMTVLRLVLIIFVGISLVLFLIGMLVPPAKATVLGLWLLLWLLAIAAVVTLQYIKQNIGFANRVSTMHHDEVQRALLREEAATHSGAALDTIALRGHDE